jgi:LDH2 family malate/lactate/ureidoglycolate dehydrogenase
LPVWPARNSVARSLSPHREIPERSVGNGLGHFFGAIEIEGFIDKDEFKKQIDDWIHVVRNTKPVPRTTGPPIPGDPERAAEATRDPIDIDAAATAPARFALQRSS